MLYNLAEIVGDNTSSFVLFAFQQGLKVTLVERKFIMEVGRVVHFGCWFCGPG
jgi:hypothetical protein